MWPFKERPASAPAQTALRQIQARRELYKVGDLMPGPKMPRLNIENYETTPHISIANNGVVLWAGSLAELAAVLEGHS